MAQLYNESQIKGMTCELQCMWKFIEKGFIVSVPYGNNSRYDLIVDIGNNKYFRIQCKTARKNENGSYTINTSNTQFTANSHTVKHYDESQIDFICSIIDEDLIVIPVSLVSNCKSKVFRSHKNIPKNNNQKSINWIEDYTIEKQFNIN